MPSSLTTELGITPDEVQILVDYPGVFTVARIEYPHGTRYEVVSNLSAIDVDDRIAVDGLIPMGAVVTGICPSNTFGLGYDGDECTVQYWIGA